MHLIRLSSAFLCLLPITLGLQACKKDDAPPLTAPPAATATPTATGTPSITATRTVTGTPTATRTLTPIPTPSPYPTYDCSGGAVTVGASSITHSNPIDTDLLRFTQFSLAQAVTLTRMAFNSQGSNSPGYIVMGIYADNAGAPWDLLGQTSPTSLLRGTNFFPLQSTLLLCPGTYWSAFNLQTSGGYYGDDHSQNYNTMSFTSGLTPGVLPNPAPSGTVVNYYTYYNIGIACPGIIFCP